jgi:cytosine/adenosine deaminase-related metal-dependent hydrolase
MSTTMILDGCHVATVDAAGTEYGAGHVVMSGGMIAAVGDGPAPSVENALRVDARGLLVTPGLVNTHSHLYQWLTRGYATDDTLFGWLTTLYPVWARITAELVHDAAAANLGWLALSGCTTSMDHHYVFPSGAGDLVEAEIAAAGEIGLRFHPTRGSMNLGRSDGGLPPDEVVETHDVILASTADAIDRWHDPAPSAMVRVAVAPCSPFSVTTELMRDCAALAREKGVRLHTHLAETADEEDFCREKYGGTSAQYAEQLGWLGPDVWMAHCVHLGPDAIRRFAATGTAVAHCPTSNGRLGAGIAPVRGLLDAGVAVGLGVDGSASNESGRMIDELHQAMLAARFAGGPLALTAREALQMATMGGARCLGRDADLGSLEVGKLADVAVWRAVDGLAGAGIDDPLVALTFGAPVLDSLYVGGREIVARGELRTADVEVLATHAAAASATMAGKDFA